MKETTLAGKLPNVMRIGNFLVSQEGNEPLLPEIWVKTISESHWGQDDPNGSR